MRGLPPLTVESTDEALQAKPGNVASGDIPELAQPMVVALDAAARSQATFAGHSPGGTVRRMVTPPHYRKPGWFTRNVFNRAVAWLTRLGISVAGSRVLEVSGRKSGEPRRTPVNLLAFDGNRYLVAPRGQTQWVRNLRVAGRGNLLLGRRSEPFSALEVPDVEKEPILREYLRRWKWEVGQFFGGVGPDAPADELARIAPDHPVFRIES